MVEQVSQMLQLLHEGCRKGQHIFQERFGSLGFSLFLIACSNVPGAFVFRVREEDGWSQ